MGIEKMSLVTVEGRADQLDSALMVCCRSEDFQIKDQSVKSMSSALTGPNPYSAAYERIRSIAGSLNIGLEYRSFADVKLSGREDFLRWAEDIERGIKQKQQEIIDLSESIEEMRRTDSCLKHLIGLDVSISDLMELKYVRIRVGKLPLENLSKLEYITNRCIHFIPFERSHSCAWGIYIVPTDYAEFADSLMDSLFFERIDIPKYIDKDADTSDKILNKVIEDETSLKKKLEEQVKQFRETHKEEILAVLCKARFLADCYDLRKNALVSAGRFSFSGYCPTRLADDLCVQLEKLDSVQTVNLHISRKDAPPNIPVKLRNNVLVRPFEMFVKMYGLPAYDSFDPTAYVAITYCLMFGIMFGDLGQGLLVSLLGFILSRKTKNGLAPIMTRIGLFSAFFGVIYGSVFGIESIITPFFHRESVWRFLGYTEQPETIFQVATTLLIAALMIGVVLILLSMIFNTVLNFKKRNWGEALFSVNGVSGLVFYASLVVGCVGTLMYGLSIFTPAYVICLIVLPLVLIFFKHPLSNLVMGTKSEEKVSVGNFIIENFIELFEAALSFLSNTMSYLRIGGFILSHAGMMLVVAQLAGTNVAGAEVTAKTVIVYIIGNLIVMGIEGLLVGIQVLRLEFYEIFNRFYDGSGQPFRPIGINFEEK